MTASLLKIFRRSLLVIQVVLVLPIGWFLYHTFMPRSFSSDLAESLPLKLSTGAFETLYFPAEHPKGIMIVATGDGGWSKQWEEPVALHAAAAGFAVGGWDCRKFADTRKFDHAQLVESFNAAVSAVRKRAGLPEDTPVWFAGWSTGADWSVAAAASPDREKHLVGVLAVSPADRSRFGIIQSDLLGLQPTGPGTFALADLAPALHGVRIVQFAGELDVLDDTRWIESMHEATPHKIITIPAASHDMNGAGARFLSEFDMAIQWMLYTPIPLKN